MVSGCKLLRAKKEEKYGKYTVTTKVISCKKVNKEDFNDYQEHMKYYYDLEVSDVREVKVEVKVVGEKDTLYKTETVQVAKIGSKWYFLVK